MRLIKYQKISILSKIRKKKIYIIISSDKLEIPFNKYLNDIYSDIEYQIYLTKSIHRKIWKGIGRKVKCD